MITKENSRTLWQFPIPYLLLIVVSTALVFLIYKGAIQELIRVWGAKEEYSYGYMIPFITAFLIWQRKDRLEKIEFTGAWSGVLAVFIGAIFYTVGELSTLYLVIQYSMVLMIMGIFLAITGWRAFRVIGIPLAFLLFMIPLPQFFLTEISQKLQFLSSNIGVAVIRLFDISVYLEGNVIDLGAYKLQVVEACSGLRYLFPLMALGFIMAYFFNGAVWKKAIIFISTIPITVLMNSFRIGAIGVMVEYWGQEMAEGFLHDFEGWVIFMACMGILLIEMWILAQIGPKKLALSTAFGIDFPAPPPSDAIRQARKIPAPLYAALTLVFATVIASEMLPDREQFVPDRTPFTTFPMKIDGWKGRNDSLEPIILDELKLDDYILADYANGKTNINLYVAYYDSQRKGESAHSPRTCIPGGGWKINDIREAGLDAPSGIKFNRVEIQKGDYKQLVYYWFQGRGRNITNEYFVKWFIFWDALSMGRTDGALVRVTSFVMPGQDIHDVESNLQDFIKAVAPVLNDYIPE